MKPIFALFALPCAALAFSLVSAPSALALNKADRALCADATEDSATILRCVKSLNERLSAIEDLQDGASGGADAKIAQLEAELHAAKAEIDTLKDHAEMGAPFNVRYSTRNLVTAVADTGGSSGETVKAPFTVTDDAGNPIFKVISNGGGSAQVIVGANNQIQMIGASSFARIILGNNAGRLGTWEVGQVGKFVLGNANSNTVVLQDGGNDGGLVQVKKGQEGLVSMTANAKMTGMSVYTAGVERANLGVAAGKGGAVRILSEGKAVAAIGANMDEGGAGALFLGMGGKNSITLLSNSSGQGALSLFNAGDTPAIQLRASDTSVGIYGDGGTPLGALQMSQNSKGGNITLMTSGGVGVVTGGGTTAGDGDLCVATMKSGTKCVGTNILPLR